MHMCHMLFRMSMCMCDHDVRALGSIALDNTKGGSSSKL